MPKNQHTEYKSKVTANIEGEVVAFLYSRNGGDIFVSVKLIKDYERNKWN